MSDTVFALIILGCSQNLDVCRDTPAGVTVHESRAQCEAHMADATQAAANFPVALGRCITMNATDTAMIDNASWFFAADGSLHLSLPPQTKNASTEAALVVGSS